MRTVAEIRREKLDLLVLEAGSQRKLAQRIGKDPKQVNQWFGKGTARNISAATCREIERLMGRPDGWMDTPEGEPAGASRAAARADTQRMDDAEYEIDGIKAVMTTFMQIASEMMPGVASALAARLRALPVAPLAEQLVIDAAVKAAESTRPARVRGVPRGGPSGSRGTPPQTDQ
jgi:DNA-binding transcriptional regulator YdaS (Cro superfamily)